MVVSTIILVIIILFIPPIGVFLMSGCGADLLINICLTLLGYFPGHIHAFYLLYVREKRKESGSGNYQGAYNQNASASQAQQPQVQYGQPQQVYRDGGAAQDVGVVQQGPPAGGYQATGYVKN